jgi:hypothetical protein
MLFICSSLLLLILFFCLDYSDPQFEKIVLDKNDIGARGVINIPVNVFLGKNRSALNKKTNFIIPLDQKNKKQSPQDILERGWAKDYYWDVNIVYFIAELLIAFVVVLVFYCLCISILNKKENLGTGGD